MRFAHSLAIALIAVAAPSSAQNLYDPATRIAAQHEAMGRLSFMNGVWRGPAWTITPRGRHDITQTERIGGFLGDSVKVVEGRGYDADGSVGFNALRVISYDPQARAYSMTSWAMGYSGTFPLRVTDNGYMWELPAGPGAIIRYTATIEGDRLREIGHRIVGDGAPVQVFEMNLRWVGTTEWPAAGPVPMR
jgi:hypothetical protein